MIARESKDPFRVRSIFVSDVHLGWKNANAEAFRDFLLSHTADNLYLVGDFIDGWRMKRSAGWSPVCTQIVCRLLEMAEEGTKLFYTPGNHDEFMSNNAHDLNVLAIADEFVHETIDGRRYLVTHGHLFDDIECSARWLSMLGASLYDVLLSVNGAVNGARARLRLEAKNYCEIIKARIKNRRAYSDWFKRRVIDHVEINDCEGIICGHTHRPTISQFDAVTYFNTGDWVYNCTAMFEHEDGRLEIVNPSGANPKLLFSA